MRTGRKPFPDERPRRRRSTSRRRSGGSYDAPRLECPNAKTGAELVAKHGGIDEAMMAYPPDSAEFDHIQAYRYVSTGKRPRGWIPPTV